MDSLPRHRGHILGALSANPRLRHNCSNPGRSRPRAVENPASQTQTTAAPNAAAPAPAQAATDHQANWHLTLLAFILTAIAIPVQFFAFIVTTATVPMQILAFVGSASALQVQMYDFTLPSSAQILTCLC